MSSTSFHFERTRGIIALAFELFAYADDARFCSSALLVEADDGGGGGVRVDEDLVEGGVDFERKSFRR
jgi:hypothetical protein